ncbi:MAG: lysylphosphatidylglycerol synthase transmembrane domain-containing protein [Dehalococcoidia bacterium]
MRLLRRRFWLRLALSGGLLGLLVWRVDIAQALRVFPDVRWVYVVPGLALYTLSKLIDTYRWQMMLSRVGRAPLPGLFGTFLISNMTNNFVPVRIGDVLRVQVPAQRYGLSRAGVTATVFVTETLVDGVAFVILALIGLTLLDLPAPLTHLVWGLLGMVVVGVVLAVLAARFRLPEGWHERGWWQWLPPWVHKTVNDVVPPFVDGLAALGDFRLGGRILGLSLVAWLLEVGMYWLFGFAFKLDISIGAYILIMIAANMIVAMPVFISNIGAYEVAVAEMVVALGAARSLAGGFAIGTHLINIVWTSICGLTAMWLMNLRFEDVLQLRRKAVPQSSEPEPV